MSTAWGGGGGGFGGFPYRSSHQGGQDVRRGGRGGRGRPSGGGRSGGGRRQGRGGSGAVHVATAELDVPRDRRGLLIGRGGSKLNEIQSRTGVSIYVPKDRDRDIGGGGRNREHQHQQQQRPRRTTQHGNGAMDSSGGGGSTEATAAEDSIRVDRHRIDPVRLRADSVSKMLHGCWEVTHTVLGRRGGGGHAVRNEEDRGEGSIACRIRILSDGMDFIGILTLRSVDGRFFAGEALDAYCIDSFLGPDEVSVLVDNERFADSGNTACCDVVVTPLSQNGEALGPKSLVFVYGEDKEKAKRLYDSLYSITLHLWRRKVQNDMKNQSDMEEGNKEGFTASSLTLEPSSSLSGGIAVGTYNLLHPTYAEKYHDPAGVDRSGRSNWNFRNVAIAWALVTGDLDVYFLQEVDAYQLARDLFHDTDENNPKSELFQKYQYIHFEHPTREAGDGVAILFRRHRFVLENKVSVPYEARLQEHSGRHYMCAAAAFVRDLQSGTRLLLVSVHFYDKKARHPQTTLLEFLCKHRKDVDSIVWGGDCNDEYKSGRTPGEEGEYHVLRKGKRCSRGHKFIDWIFYSSNLSSRRLAKSEKFIDLTTTCLDITGFPPSDHIGEAVVVALNTDRT